MRSSDPDPEAATRFPATVLVADGGAPPALVAVRDPFEALDDLMVVVEALCPIWPPREAATRMADLRL